MASNREEGASGGEGCGVGVEGGGMVTWGEGRGVEGEVLVRWGEGCGGGRGDVEDKGMVLW